LRNQDWPLVVFTIFAQASVGIVLCFTLLVHFNSGSSLYIETGLSLKNPVLLALVFVAAATLVSFSHLGNPANAPKTLNNLSSSWLSREILALGAYTACLLIIFVLGWKHGGIQYPGYLLPMGCISGVALVWMMIRLYVIPTIPPWNSWNTPLSFISTVICLGVLTFLFLHSFGAAVIDERIVYKLLLALLLVQIIEFVSALIHQSQLQKMDGGIDRPVFKQGTFHRIFLLRTGLLAIVLLALFLVILNPALVLENGACSWLCPLLFLIVVQEILARILFYSSYFRLGV
jgi:anaerobic dimethyl sulfoxide reductase subunit C (anchor subunit)